MLAQAGVGSRRACEELILQGRVAVDGQVVRELGTKVDPVRQKVAVDGQRVRGERLVYYAVCKPKGYVSTTDDPAGRPRVIDILPEIPERVYSIGRLDEQSTGLLILTNDGALANRLAHPRYGVEKLYRVVVAGRPDRSVLTKLTEGVWLAEGKVRAKRVRIAGTQGEATVLEMTLAEGKNREVRRMLANLGHKVMSLTRTAVGPITLKGLAPGEYRPLTMAEVGLLRKVAAGIAVPPPRSHGHDHRRAHDRPQPPRRGPDRARVQPPRAPASSASRTRPPGAPPPPRAARAHGSGSAPPRPPVPTPPASSRGPHRAPVRPPAPSAHGRPPRPRPPGPPPARRPASSSSSSAPPPIIPLPRPRPESDERQPRRRIIGLDSGSPPPPPPGAGPGGPPRPRPRARRPVPKHRPYPRAGLGPRRPRSGEGEQG